MTVDLPVPFFSNSPDDSHCFQDALKMVLKYFLPEKDFTWKELEQVTAKGDGLWTWPLAGMVWLSKNGFDVLDLEVFDYSRFMTEGESYLLEFYGREAGHEQIQHSDLEKERRLASELLKSNLLKQQLPTIDTMRTLLNSGSLLICLINSKKLNNANGYVGHFVVIKGYERDTLLMHDPGLPPLENRRVSIAIFKSAWAYPDKNAQNVIAIKK